MVTSAPASAACGCTEGGGSPDAKQRGAVADYGAYLEHAVLVRGDVDAERAARARPGGAGWS